MSRANDQIQDSNSGEPPNTFRNQLEGQSKVASDPRIFHMIEKRFHFSEIWAESVLIWLEAYPFLITTYLSIL